LQAVLWLLFLASVVGLVVQLARGKPKSAAVWGGVAVAAFCMINGAYWFVFWVSAIVGVVQAIRQEEKSARVWGAVAIGALVVGGLAWRPSAETATTAVESPAANATPIMEVTKAPDPYADCLANGMSKRHCLITAASERYKLTNSDHTLTESTPEPTATPEPPTPQPTTYEQSVHEQKAEFLESVDESISGAMIAGNKYKYVGENVDLHCTVFSIIDAESFNAQCGEDDDGLPVLLMVQYDDTSSLDKGQSVRILGTVEDPVEGVNGFGGEGTFPTVKAEYME
jgi:hypothetical protein